MQNVKDRIQIEVYKIINNSLNHSSQFISVKVKKDLRKSQAQFREKLRKLRLRQNNDFLIKRNMYYPMSRKQYLEATGHGGSPKAFVNGRKRY